MRYKLFFLGSGVLVLGIFMYIESWIKGGPHGWIGGIVLPGIGVIMIIESFENNGSNEDTPYDQGEDTNMGSCGEGEDKDIPNR